MRNTITMLLSGTNNYRSETISAFSLHSEFVHLQSVATLVGMKIYHKLYPLLCCCMNDLVRYENHW